MTPHARLSRRSYTFNPLVVESSGATQLFTWTSQPAASLSILSSSSQAVQPMRRTERRSKASRLSILSSSSQAVQLLRAPAHQHAGRAFQSSRRRVKRCNNDAKRELQWRDGFQSSRRRVKRCNSSRSSSYQPPYPPFNPLVVESSGATETGWTMAKAKAWSFNPLVVESSGATPKPPPLPRPASTFQSSRRRVKRCNSRPP